jgi:hypothetical protein
MPSDNKAKRAAQQLALVNKRRQQVEDGTIPFDKIPHGTNGYTNYKCRCEVCKTAASKREAGVRARRIARAKEHPEIIPHGTANGYHNYGCRCVPCTGAHAAAKQKEKAARKDRLRNR